MKIPHYISCLIIAFAALAADAQTGSANLEFIENKGQWDKAILFQGELNAGTFYLLRNGFTVSLYSSEDLMNLRHPHGTSDASKFPIPTQSSGRSTGRTRMLHSHAYSVSFIGSNPMVEILPDKPLPTYNNYFIGNDPSRWASHCRLFQGITYKNIYPNIDVRYYTSNGQLKYDIIIHPGGDVRQVALKYQGVGRLMVHQNRLQIKTSVGDVQELVPTCHEFTPAGKSEINCKYELSGDSTIKFNVQGHSRANTMVIDPTLVFCSFTGSQISNWGFTATPGPDGSFYAGGIVFGQGYPVSQGAFSQQFQGGLIDVGIIKFDPNGTNRVYATYLGGANDETPHSMICDPQGNLVVLGRTFSKDFPAITRFGPGGQADMFVVKLSAAGDQLLGSMVIGGTNDDCVNIEDQFETAHEVAESLIKNYGDDSRSEVILDGQNNIYVAASTQSATDFPIVGPVFQPKFGGGLQDGVVLKIDPTCHNILFSSFLGGSDADAAFVIKMNPVTGDLDVAGATSSTDFPGSKAGVMQPAFAGGIADGFITVISSDGTTQRRTTYLGTSAYDAVYGLGFDKSGFPYVMGSTTGNWPVVNVAYSNAGAKQYISKLQPDLSAFVYSTTFGKAAPEPNISPVAFLVDRCENVYATGWGGWIFAETDPYGLSGTIGMPTTPDAIKGFTDGRDFYFIVLKKNSSSLLYGTFYGQTDGPQSVSEHVDGGTSRYDANGVIYQAICANCGDHSLTPFPTTPGVWSPFNGTNGNGCNEAAVKIAFNFAGVSADLFSYINGIPDSSGCIPLNVRFSDTIRTAKQYIWNFGDGSLPVTTASFEENHQYATTGTYRVMLIAIDSNSCNVSDTVYLDIRGRTDSASLNFDAVKLPPCQSLSYQFVNLSKPAGGGKAFTDSSFIWNFGDGTRQTPGPDTTSHSFMSAGSYTISLVLDDTSYCNFPDSLSMTLRISSILKAGFETPDSGCVPYNATFNNISLGGQQFIWNFGDGSPLDTSSTNSVNHLYPNTGIYLVTLIANDSSTCNKSDTFHLQISVVSKPQAAFTDAPQPPVNNKPTVFTNRSTGATHYLWLFGDGDTATQSTMTDTVVHQYEKSGTFQPCLVAYNQAGCPDTVCATLQTLVSPVLDVPNAFTPGRFGQNSIIKVAGFGISSMNWKIYNRWGQIVFETNDPNVGWDGTFKGTPQPMDVYSYTITVEFSNGTKTTKVGDITLIR